MRLLLLAFLILGAQVQAEQIPATDLQCFGITNYSTKTFNFNTSMGSWSHMGHINPYAETSVVYVYLKSCQGFNFIDWKNTDKKGEHLIHVKVKSCTHPLQIDTSGSNVKTRIVPDDNCGSLILIEPR